MGNADSKVSSTNVSVGVAATAKSPSENEGTEGSTDGSTSNKDEAQGPTSPAGVAKRKGKLPASAAPTRGGGAAGRNAQASRGGNTASKAQVQMRDDEQAAPSLITDDQVQVNLAMSDLMAYLQVVANNSSNLPITKRDDMELDRFVCNLSSDEYARKAAAFVPADVRVIGGAFTRYGRVWDLPTSEEFNAVDGAQEPGKSYGGACVNSMLKVLYDAANDQVDTALAEEKAGDALFDDDEEDDSDEEGSTWGKSFKSTFSIEANTSHACTISWSDLLRKMCAEMKDIEYAQTPKITSSRKLDLSKTFSLVGENFDPKVNRKRSLLIGCNYRNFPGAELKASHDDIRSIKDYIVNVHGFPEGKGNMTILIDDDDFKYPTFMNIVEAFKVLSEESKPGDAVFVLFSGHGGRVLDAPQDAESYDEVILPYDFKQSGLIRDTLIFKTLVAPMRYGVTLTVMIDCCDTGMVFDMPYAWDVNSKPPSEKEASVASPVAASTGKMSMNENFSFVRFLKVIKTLYEASTFTQLGKTVGSALKPTSTSSPRSPRPNRGDSGTNGDRIAMSSASGEDAEMDVASERYTSKQDSMVPSHESILDVITEACRPGRRHQQARKPGSATTHGKLSKREDTTPRQSLLEQVINCTLLAPPEEDYLSDEDTFRTRTYDDEVASDAVVESFETLTEDEEDFKRSRSSRRKKR